jgi:hypothetical protein
LSKPERAEKIASSHYLWLAMMVVLVAAGLRFYQVSAT